VATRHRVEPGDCISSIAFKHGFFPETIWNHPENDDLRARRKDINVLMPGDVVFVPDKRSKTVSKPTDATHVFRYRGVPARLNIVVHCYGEPLRNKKFELEVDGATLTGHTDAEGGISIAIPPNAGLGILRVDEGERQLEFRLELGRLNPIDEVTGFKQRLQNLGYEVGDLDETVSETFRAAISRFEAEQGMPPTGECSDANRQKLREVYGR
jgi:hypothetical protein